MRKYVFLLLLGFGPWWQGCTDGACQPGAPSLDAVAFSKQLQSCPDAVVLDVRTPEEFDNGHLTDAINMDWNGAGFAQKTAQLDKSKPVFVYCLSGGRSASASQKLRADGFKTIVEMEGGILKWRSAKLPLVKGRLVKGSGLSASDYEAMLKTDQLVLVDFYADWCAPCKKMAPYLEEIKTEMAGKVQVIRIDADHNESIVKQLGIEGLPTVLIYKNGQPVWRNAGYVEKQTIVEKLASF